MLCKCCCTRAAAASSIMKPLSQQLIMAHGPSTRCSGWSSMVRQQYHSMTHHMVDRSWHHLVLCSMVTSAQPRHAASSMHTAVYGMQRTAGRSQPCELGSVEFRPVYTRCICRAGTPWAPSKPDNSQQMHPGECRNRCNILAYNPLSGRPLLPSNFTSLRISMAVIRS